MLLEQLALMPGTALHRAIAGEWADWPALNVMVARLVNAAEVANWQRGADEKEGKSKANYPEPILLPGQEWSPPNAKDTKRFGSVRMSIEQMKEWLGW